MRKNVIIFGADMSASVYIDNEYINISHSDGIKYKILCSVVILVYSSITFFINVHNYTA